MANEYLKRTPTSSGNRSVFTWSGWVKFGDINKNDQVLYSAVSGSAYVHFRFMGEDPTASRSYKFNFQMYDGSTSYNIYTDRVLRDPGSWYHIFLSVDYTQGIAGDRTKIYINNELTNQVAESGSGSPTIAAQNYQTYVNSSGAVNNIGYHSTYGEYSTCNIFDLCLVDGQALTPDVFGFYKDGDGYMSSGTTQATDFRPGQWSPRLPKSIKYTINRSGGFGVNGFYLPMNDSSNPGADFHCEPNSIIKLKGEDLPQPRNGAPTTTDAYVSQLRPEKEGTLGFDGCVRFDGTDDRLEIANNIDLELGSSDFCMEAFIFASELKNAGIFGNNQSSPSPSGYEFDIFSSGAITFYSGNGSAYSNTGGNLGTISSAGVIKTGRWHHVAAVRNGNTLRLYVDGNKVAENTSFSHTIANTTNTHQIGCDGISSGSSFHFNGLISNARLVKGSPVYTANFTPPTEPLTAITNTKLLCCQSSTDATAATVTPEPITTNGNIFATKNEILGSMVLAVPGASTAIGPDIVTNGYTWTGASGTTAPTGWVAEGGVATYSVNAGGQLVYDRNGDNVTPGRFSQDLTTVNGKVYHLMVDLVATTGGGLVFEVGSTLNVFSSTTATGIKRYTFTATSTTTTISMRNSSINGTLTIDTVKVRQVDDAPRDYSADIKGSGTNKTLTAVGNAGVGYELGGYYGSAMTFDGTGDYFDISESNTEYDLAGDYTIEFWVNFNSINNVNDIIGTANNSVFLGSGKGGWVIGYASFSNIGFRFGYQNNSSWVFEYSTGITAVANQWYHVAISHSGSTQQIIINGVVVHTATQTNTLTSTDNVLRVGGGFGSTSGLLNGQIQDFRVYKGVAKYKGGFDVPKPYTPVGIEAFRTTADTCKNNFATWNPLTGAGTAVDDNAAVLKDGNLYSDTSNQSQVTSTIGMNSGKWYAEYHLIGSSVSGYLGVTGDGRAPINNQGSFNAFGQSLIRPGAAVDNSFTKNWTATTLTTMNPALGYSSGDVFGFALDLDSSPKTLKFYRNNTLIHTDSTIGDSGHYYFVAFRTNDGLNGVNWADVVANFGQNPSFSGTTTAGTNADDSGKGLFKYAPPSGHLALCEDNLPAPAIADPGKHFKSVLYTGKGSTGTDGSQSIRKVGFQPDLVWVKKTSTSGDHKLVDSVRGSGKVLESNTADQENDESNNFTGFNFDGFDLGANNAGAWNENGYGYVAWCWKAGGPAVTNTEGTITTQVSANPEAGFSIVKSDGPGVSGHGLNSTPKWIIQKSLTTGNWNVQHHSMMTTSTGKLLLNSSANIVSSSTPYMHNATATTFDPLFSAEQIAYVWAEVEGFSKFGSYIGNGNDDGPFVYCGFKPAWVMVKRVTTGANEGWPIFDSSRGPSNPNPKQIYANSSIAEGDASGRYKDFVSNGFKVRGTSGEQNTSGVTYIFVAFAESPFQTANAK